MHFVMDISLVPGKKLIIKGEDNLKQNTVYFERDVLESGEYEFTLPETPNSLKITSYEVNEGNVPVSNYYKIVLKKVQVLKKQALIVDDHTKEFIDFARNFSEKAGYLKTGNYYSKNKKFLIRYLNGRLDQTNTPSRVHVYQGYIEVSKDWFINMSIPMRMALLLHEYAHIHMQDETLTDNNEIEKDADENALELFRGIGYQKVEWQYAWAHIFQDNEKHIERLNASEFNLHNGL